MNISNLEQSPFKSLFSDFGQQAGPDKNSWEKDTYEVRFSITIDGDCSHEIKRRLLLGRKAMTKLDSVLKKQRHYFTLKSPYSQSYGFSCSRVWMWELDYKESWVPKNGCFWTVVLEETFESLLDFKEIKPVNPKGNQSWIFIGRTDAEAEAPIFWPPDLKNWLFGKDPDVGKDWRQEEEGTTYHEMVGRHHWHEGHNLSKLWEFVMERKGWHAAVHGVTKTDMTEPLNWTGLLGNNYLTIMEILKYFDVNNNDKNKIFHNCSTQLKQWLKQMFSF